MWKTSLKKKENKREFIKHEVFSIDDDKFIKTKEILELFDKTKKKSMIGQISKILSNFNVLNNLTEKSISDYNQKVSKFSFLKIKKPKTYNFDLSLRSVASGDEIDLDNYILNFDADNLSISINIENSVTRSYWMIELKENDHWSLSENKIIEISKIREDVILGYLKLTESSEEITKDIQLNFKLLEWSFQDGIQSYISDVEQLILGKMIDIQHKMIDKSDSLEIYCKKNKANLLSFDIGSDDFFNFNNEDIEESLSEEDVGDRSYESTEAGQREKSEQSEQNSQSEQTENDYRREDSYYESENSSY